MVQPSCAPRNEGVHMWPMLQRRLVDRFETCPSCCAVLYIRYTTAVGRCVIRAEDMVHLCMSHAVVSVSRSSGARHEIAMRDLIVSLQLPLTVAEHVPPLTVTQSTLSQSFQPTTPTINFLQSHSTSLSHRDPIGKAVLGRFSLVTWADIMEAVVMQVVAGRTNRRLRATSARLRRFAIQASRC